MAMRDDFLKYVLLGILTLTWGSSFFLIKKGVESFTPYQVGALRIGFAGIVLVLISWKHFKYIPKNKIKWIMVAGITGNFVPIFLFPLAEVRLDSAVAGILNSMVPLFVLMLGFWLFRIPYTRIQSLGAVIGFVGVLVLMLFGAESFGSLHIPSVLLVLLATSMYAFSGLIVKTHLTSIPALSLTAVIYTIFIIPATFILFLTGFFQQFASIPGAWEALGYMAILGILGTAAAMILFYNLIQRVSAVFASSVTYLMPIVAIGWGILDGEHLYFIHLIGVLLILVGVYLIREKRST